MEVKGKKEVVSIDHLKPAFLELPSLPQPDVNITPQPTTTASNRDKLLLAQVVMYAGRNIFPSTVSGGGVL